MRDSKTRAPLYHVTWKSAKIDVAAQGVFAGSMENVTGEMYKNGLVVNSFTADHAKAEKSTQMLTLWGNPKVVSNQRSATLTCDTVRWLPGDKMIKASGHVKVSGKQGTLGPADELWATQKLDQIATPDMFKP